MNFYIDFEALQFSGRIISIGCVNDNGEKFYTLCKPSKHGEKVNEFITQLTGITNEMLDNAPTSDEAFEGFYDYVKTTRGETRPVFYCYGSSDEDFLRATSKYLTSFEAMMFCDFIRHNLIDYSATAKSFFPNFGGIALKKVFSLIQEDNEPQRHNALEDAEMLCTVVKELCNHCTPEDKDKLAAMPGTRIKKPQTFTGKRAPEKFINWPNNKLEADTGATKDTDWQYMGWCGNQTKYFDTFDTMVMWAIRYVTSGRSIKKASDVRTVEDHIKRAIEFGTAYMNGGHWKKREG